VCICWSTTRISVLRTYITGNKTVSVLVIRVQCSTRLTQYSTSVQITSKLFFSPVLHFLPRQLFISILYSFASTDNLAAGYGSWPTVTTVLDNNLISKMSYFFPLLLILISVPDDGFKLQAEICRTFYTLEVQCTDIFIYNTHKKLDVLAQDFAGHIYRFLS